MRWSARWATCWCGGRRRTEGAGGLGARLTGAAGGRVRLLGAVHNSGRMDGLPVVRRRGGVMLRIFLSCEPNGGRCGVSTGSTGGGSSRRGGAAGGGEQLVGTVHNSGRIVGLPVVRRRSGVMLRIFLSYEPNGGPRRGLDRLDQRRGAAGRVSTGSSSGRRVSTGSTSGRAQLVGAVHNSGRMDGLPVVRRPGGVMLRVFLSYERNGSRGGVSTGSAGGRLKLVGTVHNSGRMGGLPVVRRPRAGSMRGTDAVGLDRLDQRKPAAGSRQARPAEGFDRLDQREVAARRGLDRLDLREARVRRRAGSSARGHAWLAPRPRSPSRPCAQCDRHEGSTASRARR